MISLEEWWDDLLKPRVRKGADYSGEQELSSVGQPLIVEILEFASGAQKCGLHMISEATECRWGNFGSYLLVEPGHS